MVTVDHMRRGFLRQLVQGQFVRFVKKKKKHKTMFVTTDNSGENLYLYVSMTVWGGGGEGEVRGGEGGGCRGGHR